MEKSPDSTVLCPLLGREIAEGYCWELCNLATDEILAEGDAINDWDKAYEICERCGRYRK